MFYRLGLMVWAAGLLLLTTGCNPKCREVKPLAEVHSETEERVDDALDDVDASDAQRAQIQKVFAAHDAATVRLRKVVWPLQHALMAELRRDPPNRAKVGALIDQHMEASTQYVIEFVDMMLAGHALLTPEQRKKMVERYTRPTPPFEGSFLLDRAVDLFLLRLDANDEQKKLVHRILRQLVDRTRVLQQRADAMRLEAGAEFTKEHPDRARILNVVARGRAMIRQMFFDMAGYYLLLQSKLEPKQRALLGAELLRFEPCEGLPGGEKTAKAGVN